MWEKKSVWWKNISDLPSFLYNVLTYHLLIVLFCMLRISASPSPGSGTRINILYPLE